MSDGMDGLEIRQVFPRGTDNRAMQRSLVSFRDGTNLFQKPVSMGF